MQAPLRRVQSTIPAAHMNELEECDALEGIRVGELSRRPVIAAPRPKPAKKQQRTRPRERRAVQVVDDLSSRLTGAEGFVDSVEVVETLRRSLKMVDPEYVRGQKALSLVDALRSGLSQQGKDKTSRGIARAVGDLASDGLRLGASYSATAASSMLGVAVSGKRTRDQVVSAVESFLKPRKRHKQAFSMGVKKAVAEFAFAYCKYEEKQYVSVLPARQVWEIYCIHHDRDSQFYRMGTLILRCVGTTRLLSNCKPLGLCSLGSPQYLEWRAEKLQAQIAGTPFLTPQPRPISEGMWYTLYPATISREKWRSCVCHVCSEVEDLLNTWGPLMTVAHSASDDPVRRGEVARRINVKCEHSGCRWNLPEDNLLSLTLPDMWPARFKNLVTRPTVAESLQLQLPTLFCSPCGCGDCELEELERKASIGIEVAK